MSQEYKNPEVNREDQYNAGYDQMPPPPQPGPGFAAPPTNPGFAVAAAAPSPNPSFAAPPGVVYQQPPSSHTTVIVQQPTTTGVKLPRDWSSGLCSCCDDMEICLCGAFCGLCLACQVSTDMHESSCLPCCVNGFLMALRVKMRTAENIQGSIMNDHTVTCCCGPCAMCQLAREIKFVKGQAMFNMPM